MELNEVGLCYFAALIERLRVISEKEEDLGIPAQRIDCTALIQYVRVKGDRLVALHYGLRENPDAVKRLKDVWPKAEVIKPIENYRKWAQPVPGAA